MSEYYTSEAQQNSESPGKLKKFLAKSAMAAVFLIPIADLALSDATVIWGQQKLHNEYTGQLHSGLEQVAIEDAAVASFVFGQSVALGLFVSRRKKLQGAFDGYLEHSEEKNAKKGPIGRGFSRVVGLPTAGFIKLGEKAKAKGEEISESDGSEFKKAAGRLLLDTGQVNAEGTTLMIMGEAGLSDEPVSMRRIAKLSGLITATYLGLLEGIRGTYNLADHLSIPGELYREGMQGIGRGINYLTDLNIEHPLSSPGSTIALGTAAVLMAKSGWNLAGYREHLDAQAQEADASDEGIIVE